MLHTVKDVANQYIKNAESNLHPFINETFQSEILREEIGTLNDDAMNFENDGDGDCEAGQFYLKLCGNYKKTLNQPDQRITDADLEPLCAALTNCANIYALDLRYNKLSDAGAHRLADLLKCGTCHVKHVNLMCNEIGESGAQALAEALHVNTSLEVLRMTGNKIGTRGGMYFAQALQVNSSLVGLDLGDCDLKIDSLIAFSTVLKQNTTLNWINLDRPLLWTQGHEEQTVHLAQILVFNRTLQRLHLAKYPIRDYGIARICDALYANTSLTVLDVSCNRITRDGAKTLANLLRTNSPLKQLDLAYNRIQSAGVIHIASALTLANTKLEALSVAFNEIEPDGLISLADMLHHNFSLRQLFIWGNNSDPESCAKFAELIQAYEPEGEARDELRHFTGARTVNRLAAKNTDVRPYIVDVVTRFAHTSHDFDYRRFRYTSPIYGNELPANRSDCLF